MTEPPAKVIMGRRLTRREAAKLERARDRLSGVFTVAGYPVRTCEGGVGNRGRKISFIFGVDRDPFISLPASQLLSASEDALVESLQRKLGV